MADGYRIGYEPQSVREIARFAGYQQELGPRLGNASRKSAELIRDTIPQVTNWQHGTNTLDSSWYVAQSSVYEAAAKSDLPYAMRRDKGFSGMTDRLGRFYPDDPGAFYAEKALDQAMEGIEDIYDDEIQSAFPSSGY